jgi:alpha,alpha-trehalase
VYQLKNHDHQRLQDLPLAKDAPPEFVGGREVLQFMYPAGWASTQMIVIGGLNAYGYRNPARRISARFLGLLLDQYKRTGQLWEKYNVVDGSLILPNSRYGNIPYHSFTTAAVVLLGRYLFENRTFRAV